MKFKQKEKKKKNQAAYDFSAAIRGRKLPLLVLDERWLELFGRIEMTEDIMALQKELNKLLVKQGKLNEEMNALKRYKSQLLQEIVENMGVDESTIGQLKARKMDKNQRLVNETREKIAMAEEIFADLPNQIQKTNEELLLASSKLCYDKMREDRERMEELERELLELNEAVKMKILEKRDKEAAINSMYTYMHNMYGAKIMEILDKNEEMRDE